MGGVCSFFIMNKFIKGLMNVFINFVSMFRRIKIILCCLSNVFINNFILKW